MRSRHCIVIYSKIDQHHFTLQIGQTACIAFQILQLNINNASFFDFIFRDFHGLLTGSTGILHSFYNHIIQVT